MDKQTQAGLKRADLKPCPLCGKGLAHDHSLNVYRIAIEMHVLHMSAIRRQHGLELMMGTALANIFSPDEDMTVPLASVGFVTICFDCAVKWHVAGLLESLATDEPEAAKDETEAPGNDDH